MLATSSARPRRTARAAAALALGLAALPSLAAAGVQRFDLDEGHQWVEAAVPHFGVGVMKVFFPDVSGFAMVDEERPESSSVSLSIQTGTLASNNVGRADAVKSEHFLDTERFPEITFRSKKLAKKGEGYLVTGDLTIRDVTREVTFPIEVIGPRPSPFGGPRLGVTGSLTVSRKDFGVPFDRAMPDGTPIVGDEARLWLNLEFTKAEEE